MQTKEATGTCCKPCLVFQTQNSDSAAVCFDVGTWFRVMTWVKQQSFKDLLQILWCRASFNVTLETQRGDFPCGEEEV